VSYHIDLTYFIDKNSSKIIFNNTTSSSNLNSIHKNIRLLKTEEKADLHSVKSGKIADTALSF